MALAEDSLRYGLEESRGAREGWIQIEQVHLIGDLKMKMGMGMYRNGDLSKQHQTCCLLACIFTTEFYMLNSQSNGN